MNNNRNEHLVKAFGQHVRLLRKAKNLSMEKLAEKSGIDYRLLAYIENGEINTTISTAFLLAKGLEIEFKELFEFSVPQGPASDLPEGEKG